MSQRRWCPCRVGVNCYQVIARGLLGEETWSLCACILPSLRMCPICCEVLNLLRTIRREGGGYTNEYKLAFPEVAWDVGYLIHLCFIHTRSSPLRERILKIRGETLLDHVVFWFSHANQQVKTRGSPFSLWDLAGKALLLTPIRKEADLNDSLSEINRST